MDTDNNNALKYKLTFKSSIVQALASISSSSFL